MSNREWLDDLGVIARVRNCLLGADILSMEELLATSKTRLMEIPNFGKGCFDHLCARLLDNGYEVPWNLPSESMRPIQLANMHSQIKLLQKRLAKIEPTVRAFEAMLRAAQKASERQAAMELAEYSDHDQRPAPPPFKTLSSLDKR